MDNDPVDFRKVRISDPAGYQQINRKQDESAWSIWLRECVIPVVVAGFLIGGALGGLLWWLGR